MTADPHARLDAACLLGALDAEEHLAYEAHLAICPRCRAGLAEISAIPSPLAHHWSPGQRVIVTSGTALTETQIKNLQITQPTGPPSSPWGDLLFRTAGRWSARGP